MTWTVLFHTEFEAEFDALGSAVKEELAARLGLLEAIGPSLGRPTVDTLSDNDMKNLKEIRFKQEGVWRFLFAFDPKQDAIVLIGGDKEGVKSDRFYKRLIHKAKQRYARHLEDIEE